MRLINNLFVTYGLKGAEYFCNRFEEIREVINGLHNEHNITLIAHSRIGKTHLIHHVFADITV